jgi:hypothetical protein
MKYLLTEGFTLISTTREEMDWKEFVVLTYSDKRDFIGARSEIFEGVSPLEYRKVLELWKEINSKEIKNGSEEKQKQK